MADVSFIKDIEITQTSTPTYPVVTVGRKISDSDTTLITSTTLLNKDGTVITKACILGIRRADGYVENVYVAAGGITGTTVTITTRGLKLGGIDFTTAGTGLAVSHEQGEEVFLNVSGIMLQQMVDVMQGDIASGGYGWKIGDGTDQDITVTAYNADANKPFWQYDKDTNQWIFSNDGVSTTPFGTGAGVTGGDGISVTAGDIDIDLADTTIFKNARTGNEIRVPITAVGDGKLDKTFMPTYVEDLINSGTTVTEIDQALDGISANVTATNLNTLTAGTSSSADSLHVHNVPSYYRFADQYGYGVNSADWTINNTAKYNKAAVSPNGNYLYLLRFVSSGATMYISRYTKDTTGIYYHDNTAVSISEAGSYGSSTYGAWSPGLTVGDTYVWVAVAKTDNSVSKILRFDADLTNETLMTGDGPATSGALCGGDSTLYMFPNTTNTVYPITVSGTTITTGGSSVTPLSGTLSAYFDGTYLHQHDGSTYHKINTSGTSQASRTMQMVEMVSFGAIGSNFYTFGTQLMNKTYSSDVSNDVYKYWDMTRITKL